MRGCGCRCGPGAAGRAAGPGCFRALSAHMRERLASALDSCPVDVVEQLRAPRRPAGAPAALAVSRPRSPAPMARHPRRPAAPSTNSHARAMRAPGSTLGASTVPHRGRPCGRSWCRSSRVSVSRYRGGAGSSCRPVWSPGGSWGEPLPVRTTSPQKQQSPPKRACQRQCVLLLATARRGDANQGKAGEGEGGRLGDCRWHSGY